MPERGDARLGLALVVAMGGVACSGSGTAACGVDAASDVGSDVTSDVADGDAVAGEHQRDFPGGPLTGIRSFDMTATVKSDGALAGTRATFTLVLDSEAKAAYVGRGLSLFDSTDGAFFAIRLFTIGDLPSDVGAALGPLSIDGATLTYAGGVLSGTAQAYQLNLPQRGGKPLQVSLVGTPDDTAPGLTLYPDEAAIDPFIGLLFSSSEPLPPSSAARLEGALVGATSNLDLVPYFASDPTLAAGASPESPAGAVFAFGKPDVVLRYGASYKLAADRLTDFAGLLLADGGTGAAFITPPAPPLLTPDGFESASVDPQARIVEAPDFPVLAGAHSLYIGRPEMLSRPCSTQQISLATLRLAVPPGARSVRFSYRAVSTFAMETGRPSVAVGSEGGSISRADLIGTLVPTKVASPDGGQRYFGEPRTFEVALPVDVGPEVLVDFEDLAEGCGVPRSPTGLLVDDLRVE